MHDSQNNLFTVTPEVAMYGYGFFPKHAWKDAWRFILPSLASKLFHVPAAWRDVEEVRYLMELYLKTVDTPAEFASDMQGIEAGWPRMREMLRHNRGMTKLMLDHGHHSRIVYPFILQGAQAVSLEVFFGRSFDLSGNFVEIPLDELAAYYAVWEPIGVFIRERIAYAQRQLRWPKLKVLTCGAGYCPEWRLNDFPAENLKHDVTAVDEDERLFDYLQLVYGRDPEELGIHYVRDTIENVCSNEAQFGSYDIVLAQGILSYYRDIGNNKRTVELLRQLKQMLRPDGKLIFDLQVFEPTLVRCAECMGWESKLLPDWTAKSAIRRMKKACAQAGLELTDYKVDSRNPTPCGVMFTAKPQT